MKNAIERVLIAVDDSIESLEAARTGARIAAGWGALVRVINVVPEGTVNDAIARRLLAYVAHEVQRGGVAPERVETMVRAGQPFRRILEEARAWEAGLIVMAVSNRVGLRSPYVGSETEHVLEFTECPVLVVPAPPAGERAG
jgi:nucleotide-binding universal stress UspA family protein